MQAEFYSWAYYGKGLSHELRGGGPASVGGKKAKLTALSAVRALSPATARFRMQARCLARTLHRNQPQPAARTGCHAPHPRSAAAHCRPCLTIPRRMQNNLTGVKGIAKELADDEINHVKFLRAALGDAAVPCPKMDVGPAFAAAAAAAVGVDKLTPTFDPYANDLFFLHGAFIFEDVGVTAYNGAVAPVAALLPTRACPASAALLLCCCVHTCLRRCVCDGAERELA
jgi:Ferritin-like domain